MDSLWGHTEQARGLAEPGGALCWQSRQVEEGIWIKRTPTKHAASCGSEMLCCQSYTVRLATILISVHVKAAVLSQQRNMCPSSSATGAADSHRYSAPSRSMSRIGKTLAQGVSHFCIRIPKRKGGLGSSRSCRDWKVGLM